MQTTSCLLCGASEGHEVFRNPVDKYHRQFDHLRDHDSILVMCAGCGFAYHNPKLSEAETELIYRVLYRPAVPSEELLTALFGLSRAEARLALCMLMGRSAADCARLASVGLATIRTQLHSIFTKTGVRRQAQLVALLSKVPVLQLGTKA